MEKEIIGISTSNPVDFDKDYLLFTAKYAIEHGIKHYQFIGPIHNPIKGNLDGMTFYRKYAQFNSAKEKTYVEYCLQTTNEVLDRLSAAGIKSYMWHHELELPIGFEEMYPEILNSDSDVEITHPIVKDFLENKIEDFFFSYPKMNGIVLTLHETRIPLLKLKNQKLGKIERVKYVTQILFDTCKRLGKELIVRPFASIEEDYQMMTTAYEEISKDLIIMDKWTQFDWSLTLPNNAFFNKIKKNPLFVETDIFGEYFGKGFLPIMLKEHIIEKVKYCNTFSPVGYCSRIDRNGYDPFGSVQEVNLRIMEACLNDFDVETTLDDFFKERYGVLGKQVRDLMEGTEEIQKKIFYLNGYYFTELSSFPQVNHCKNHFYIEIMKENYSIASNEWFVPKNWERGSIESILEEKKVALFEAENKLKNLQELKELISEESYVDLEDKFKNLYYVAKLWLSLTKAFIAYANHDKLGLELACEELLVIDCEGKKFVKDNYYPIAIAKAQGLDSVPSFVSEIRNSFEKESHAEARLRKEDLTDYIVCGGGNEGHNLQKEVNFSDTYILEDGVCRIPGTNRGKDWSTVNAHGWFSYLLKTKPNEENEITVVAKGGDGNLEMSVDIEGGKTVYRKRTDIKEEIKIKYFAKNTTARIRIDRISSYTPFIYEIKVK
jgi:hypothetical protein